jgi:hypothetical protein
MTDTKREVTTEELTDLQHEAFILGQATGMLLKYGYKELATQVYTTAYAIINDPKLRVEEGTDVGQ